MARRDDLRVLAPEGACPLAMALKGAQRPSVAGRGLRALLPRAFAAARSQPAQHFRTLSRSNVAQQNHSVMVIFRKSLAGLATSAR
ncbi:MAG: hypothetical protein ACYS5V_03675 [Planctomycetota bacterium]|jgi:hypothetical protein